jgi:hypothetical protein
MHHFPIGFRVTLVVIDIPAKCMKERIGEILAELGFVIISSLTAKIGIAMECVLINKGLDPFGDCHCFDIKNRKRLNVLNLSYQKYFSTRPRSLFQTLR